MQLPFEASGIYCVASVPQLFLFCKYSVLFIYLFYLISLIVRIVVSVVVSVYVSGLTQLQVFNYKIGSVIVLSEFENLTFGTNKYSYSLHLINEDVYAFALLKNNAICYIEKPIL